MTHKNERAIQTALEQTPSDKQLCVPAHKLNSDVNAFISYETLRHGMKNVASKDIIQENLP